MSPRRPLVFQLIFWLTKGTVYDTSRLLRLLLKTALGCVLLQTSTGF